MSTERDIWDLFIKKGFTQEATAGIMGNTYAESNNKTNNLQNSGNKRLGWTDEEYTEKVNSGEYTLFAVDSIGYGLAQWTHSSRKKGLIDLAHKNKVSIDDADLQVTYFIKELSSYGLLNKIKTSTDIREVTKIILTQFEKPASVINKSQAEVEKVVDRRYKYSMNIYNAYRDTFKDDLSVLVKYGVIQSPDYWEKHRKDVPYLETLIHRAAIKINDIGDIETDQLTADLNVLGILGIVTDKKYWEEHVDDIKYLDSLIHNIAKLLSGE